MKHIIQLLLISICFIGCKSSQNEAPVSTEMMVNSDATQKTESVNRKLIKDASLSFRTKDNEETYNLIKSSLKSFGAYISDENTYNYSNRIGYNLTVKVPAEKFDSLLNFVLENAEIRELENKSTSIQDVTEEYIDIEARIKIKKETEQKLIELLKQARNLSETLEVQNQLTNLQAEIESIEGRLKYLSNQVNYSTIHISFFESKKYSGQFFTDFWDALKQGWQVFLRIITLLAYLWVIILAFFIIRWGYKYYKRRKKTKEVDIR